MLDKNQKEIYILNPSYGLRTDKKRVIIFQKSIDPVVDKESTDILAFIHPIYAIVLSLFNGKDKLQDVIENISKLLRMDKAAIDKLISPLLENEEELTFNYEMQHFHLPKNLLIKNKRNLILEDIDIRQFFIPKTELDFDSWRLYYPLDILFVINSVCATDCIYCYADVRKKIDCQIPMKRLRELIKEARDLGIRSFDLTGGEIFLYSHWEEFLKELVLNNFKPYISTKVPINMRIINKLKDIGINNIQISIDSLVKEELVQILKVKESYREKILETFRNLDDNGFEIYTNTQMTNINENSIEELVNFLSGLKNIKRINVGAAGVSLYNGLEYTKFRPTLEAVNRVDNFIDALKQKFGDRININFSGYLSAEDYFAPKEKKKKNFNTRARCSGNFYALIILPDGRVTICEELYYHPAFILGDLKTQSIEDVWNSKKALELYKLSKDSIQDGSICKTCDEFDSCHQYRGVCWKEILYAYGYDNWDYPDPRCPKAPCPQRLFYLEEQG